MGQRIEHIPKNFDFGPNVERVNQVLSYEGLNGFVEPRTSKFEDEMRVAGLGVTATTQDAGFSNN